VSGAVGGVAVVVTGELPSAVSGASCVRAAANSSKVLHSPSSELGIEVGRAASDVNGGFPSWAMSCARVAFSSSRPPVNLKVRGAGLAAVRGGAEACGVAKVGAIVGTAVAAGFVAATRRNAASQSWIRSWNGAENQALIGWFKLSGSSNHAQNGEVMPPDTAVNPG
jgi:hypothetical protein